MILSDVVWIPFEKPIDSIKIERTLNEKFGEIIRWAIIDVQDESLKICLSYIKQA